MGSVLVRRLLAAGLDVLIYNRTKAKAEPLAADGAKIVDRAADLGQAKVVFVMVGTSQNLLDALLGPAGLMAGEHAPAIVIDLSTVSVEASRQARQELAARGTQFLAAPVMGNPGWRKPGRLTFALSGSPDAAEQARPYLEVLGAGASYVGAGEIARTVKLCHNLFLGVVIQSLAEVTVLAQKAGVTRQAFLACINDSVMGSTFTRYKSPALVNLDFHATFTSELLRKDFDLGLAAAREHEVPMPVAVAGPSDRAEPRRARVRRAGFRDRPRAAGPVGGPATDQRGRGGVRRPRARRRPGATSAPRGPTDTTR